MSKAELLRAWHDHLAIGQRKSPHTVRAYHKAAERLLARQELIDWPDVATLTATRLRTHMASRRAEGLANTSAARELSALKGFIAFARAQAGDDVTDPPRMRGPRIKKGLPRPVTPDDATALAETVEAMAGEAWTGARDRAVLLLLYGAGMRIAEALSLTADVLPLGERLTVTGKGGKQRVVPILPIVSEAVADYARQCPWSLSAGEPLFRGAKAVRCRKVWCKKRRRGLAKPWVCPILLRRMRYGTVSPPICWAREQTCGVSRNCSAMPASVRRRSTRRSMPRNCSRPTAPPIRATGIRTRFPTASISTPARHTTRRQVR